MPKDLPWRLRPGDRIRRVQLHDEYGGVRQGGVSPSSSTSNLFLFTDTAANAAHGYVSDRWIAPDLFLYCGKGLIGDQRTDGYNGSILKAASVGRAIRLFRGWKGIVTYVGEFVVDLREPFFWAAGPDSDGRERRVVMMRLRPVGFTAPLTDITGGDPETGRISEDSLEGCEAVSAHFTGVGQDYQPANEAIEATPRPAFLTDPDVIDRGLRGHATAQNLLAAWIVASGGGHALSPRATDPKFDLAWELDEQFYVAEVKSVTLLNEITQIRLGIGQVLDYAVRLQARPVLMLERRPNNDHWVRVTREYGIVLLWPSRLVEQPARTLLGKSAAVPVD